MLTLDCGGRSVTGAGSGFGITSNRSGLTIKNCVVSGFLYGIHLVGGSNNTVKANTLFDNTDQGIALNTTTNSRVADNTVSGHPNAGIGLMECHNNEIVNNLAIDGGGGIGLNRSSGNKVAGNTALRVTVGLASNSSRRPATR